MARIRELEAEIEACMAATDEGPGSPATLATDAIIACEDSLIDSKASTRALGWTKDTWGLRKDEQADASVADTTTASFDNVVVRMKQSLKVARASLMASVAEKRAVGAADGPGLQPARAGPSSLADLRDTQVEVSTAEMKKTNIFEQESRRRRTASTQLAIEVNNISRKPEDNSEQCNNVLMHLCFSVFFQQKVQYYSATTLRSIYIRSLANQSMKANH
jgi:hypothetical protein